jgi:hypothetical protein
MPGERQQLGWQVVGIVGEHLERFVLDDDGGRVVGGIDFHLGLVGDGHFLALEGHCHGEYRRW